MRDGSDDSPVDSHRCCGSPITTCGTCVQRIDALWAQRPRIRLHLRSKGVQEDQIDDVLSDVYLTAWRRLDLLPANHDAAVGWLFVTVGYVLSNHRRGRSRRRSLIHRVADEVNTASAALAQPIETTRLEAIEGWRSLNQDDRHVLYLSLSGLALDHIAYLFDCSRSAAAMRLSRARRRLTEQSV